MVRERDSTPAPLEDAAAANPATLSRDKLPESGQTGPLGDDLFEEARGPLFPAQEAADLRRRWEMVQAGFVDEPRRAVRDADDLVAVAMERLNDIFAKERANLETQWDRGDEVSTEDLRLSLRRYRSFFGRLLSI